MMDAYRPGEQILKHTSCICDYFLRDDLLMCILYGYYFDTQNNASNMLDNIWFFLLFFSFSVIVSFDKAVSSKKYFFFRFQEIGNETETTAVIGLPRRINILIKKCFS